VTVRGRAAKGGLTTLLGVVLFVVGAAAASAAPTGGASALAASEQARNPTVSMTPSPAFEQYCFETAMESQCNAAALADIDRGRRADHLPPLRLPRGFATRSAPAQLRALANLERTVRHLPSMPRSPALDARAMAAAAQGVDPSGPGAYYWGANLATGYVTALAADFAWMYDDGPGSPNTACPPAGGAGCWGHRMNILAAWGGSQGNGDYVSAQGRVQLTELFVENY
jgi:hypothetical protein